MKFKSLLALFFAAIVTTNADAADYGAAMPEGEAIDIAVAATDPAARTGAPALYRGRITQVCQKAGCWVVLESDGHSARVMAKDHGFAVPKDASGEAIAWGVLEVEPISEDHARHLVEDDGAAAPASEELRIVATAIRVL
ncbi:DUF4920 domain-containing protein [Arenimonas composti]|uniref:DUF4920 domain-containing protein n=1 Tax=Arenimonas composti TR7-09 = DSM 18010 TaxID=1121013 RepID=A0A091BHU1_9GAMM|nr:DUF4920 domain-containing protein [Arenimonas composti]KFN51097.1 hypothetical protein P873_04135 [Arenimonas composti TR7-09 = DSM 18010]